MQTVNPPGNRQFQDSEGYSNWFNKDGKDGPCLIASYFALWCIHLSLNGCLHPLSLSLCPQGPACGPQTAAHTAAVGASTAAGSPWGCTTPGRTLASSATGGSVLTTTSSSPPGRMSPEPRSTSLPAAKSRSPPRTRPPCASRRWQKSRRLWETSSLRCVLSDSSPSGRRPRTLW